MEYGLRRYEATQRLVWFLFFLACLGVAYLMLPGQLPAPSKAPAMSRSIQPEMLKSLDFWFNLRWIHVEPMGKAMIYLTWALSLFLMGRLLGLMVQYVGKFYIRSLLSMHIRWSEAAPKFKQTALSASPEVAFPVALLLEKTDNILLQMLFHAFRRLKVLLANPGGTLSSERLAEKERRLAETDWEILWGSWTPFRWLLRLLPVVGVVQTAWLVHQILQPALSGQKDFQELFGLVFNGLLPLLQVIFLTVAFTLASGLLKRLESFYLSGVDTLFYDRFITRLPFQSSDTPILLEMLQRNFRELHEAVNRLERSMAVNRDSEGRRR